MEKDSVIVAGVDVGAATTKAVILDTDKILSYAIIPTGFNVTSAAETVTEQCLIKAGLPADKLQYVISTGYGRRAVPFSNKALTEIICHAAGVSWAVKGARTIIDIGGQDSKVIALDDSGKVVNFVMNDKCAAGTGRFLEVMAKILGLEVDDIGAISLLGKEPCPISNTCTVFAESEVVSLRAEGKSRENMLAGIHKAMANRVAIMGKPVGFKENIVFTGGVAKNAGMKIALEEQIGLKIIIPENPQLTGALGAAILAKTELANLHDP